MKTVKDRLGYVRKMTGCTKATAFAAWVGARSPQAVGAWEARDSISSDGALKVHKATNANVKWLLSGEGEPFGKEGPTIYAGADPPELVERVRVTEDETQGLINVMTTVLQSLSAMMPDAGRGLLAALRALPPGDSGSQRQVLEAASGAVELGLRSVAPASRPAARRGSPGKPPQKGR